MALKIFKRLWPETKQFYKKNEIPLITTVLLFFCMFCNVMLISLAAHQQAVLWIQILCILLSTVVLSLVTKASNLYKDKFKPTAIEILIIMNGILLSTAFLAAVQNIVQNFAISPWANRDKKKKKRLCICE